MACEFSGIVRDAFLARGHDAVSCDLLPTESPGPHIQGDAIAALHSQSWDLLIAHPPCTHLATSGAAWFAKKAHLQGPALDFVRALMSAPVARIAIENPVSIISSRIRKPDQIIQPWHFGDRAQKTTCLWLKGLPPLLSLGQSVESRGGVTVHASGKRSSDWSMETFKLPAKERSHARSKTVQGIANAMADQWGTLPIIGAVA